MKARNPAVTAALQDQVAKLSNRGWYHSIELPDGSVIAGLQTVDKLRWRLAQFPVANDLRGKRVLDIGAWDGGFTFELERRGASVLAIDTNPGTNFLKAKQLTGSQAEYRILDVLDLSVDVVGVFDLIVFFGVLYHLKHPLLALEKICAIATGTVLVESYVSDHDLSDLIPRMEFYEHTELCGQFDNWVGPNTACLLAWCRTAGFATVTLESVHDQRAHVTCQRRWPEPGATYGEPPYIVAVQNATAMNLSFSATKDEYVSVWFDSDQQDLGLDDVFPTVGPYGTRPVGIAPCGERGWLTNFKLPLGLPAGWHELSLRVRQSPRSNAVRIGLDVIVPPEISGAPNGVTILAMADNNTWEQGLVHLGPESCVAVWIRRVDAESWSRRDFEIRLDGSSIPAIYASEATAAGAIQICARIPSGLSPGTWKLQVAFRADLSQPSNLELV